MAQKLTPLDPKMFKPDKLCAALSYAVEVRKSEIDRFWSRSLVFWGLVGASFVAYAAFLEKKDIDAVRLAVCCFGFLSSLVWTLQNRGSKYWQESWEAKVAILEKEVLGGELFANKEPRQRKGLWGAWRFSVSRLMVAVSDLAVLIWALLIYVSASSSSWVWTQRDWSAVPVGAISFTAVYALALLIFGRSGR